ncbi:CRAL/TRIO domain-containing protein [Aspergillus steynii IBT 23096]|uniref:Phosphatidylinositol transfer protein SFH5 n=1 Tax=Aspergillus steynii IBT 23096 TaxID=1392250 RepID=A0A2I2GG66_9EURO|nr:CRAL/TRIO domain-containing protein [Aspergillus steynii IBT 23096]PLB51876.1 CRAL/TRIO domain-containing protein [Aspergillus steynii IBT 23096]
MSEQQDKTAPPAPEVVENKPVEPASETTAAPAPVPEAQPEQTPAEPAQKETVPAEQPSETAPASEAAPEAVPEAAPKAAPKAAPEAAPETTEPAAPAAQEVKDGQQETPAADAKPDYLTKNPSLGQLLERLPSILSSSGHDEMWGVPLKDSADAPTVNVLIKFLRANEGNAKLAEEQLTKALQWRKQMNPAALVESGRFNASKFGGLGYLTTYQEADNKELVVTWNIYGAVKNIDDTFGDMDEFVKWRVALMELAVQELKLAQATSVIEYDGEDPYQMVQVHDYLNLSFLRLNPNLRAATKKTIDVFTTAYPELLREKFFVNVPSLMGWMFAAMKVFLSKNTTRKFHPISNGANLGREFNVAVKEKLPKAYGGNGPALQESAKTVKLEEEPVPAPAAAPAPEPEKEATKVAPQEAPTQDTEVPKEEPKREEPPKADAAVTAQEAPVAGEAK